MREKHHEGHHQDQITEYFPMFSGSANNFTQCRNPMMLPGFRLLEPQPDVKCQQRGNAAYPEHGAPSPDRQHKSGCYRGEKIANGISTLQYAGKDTSPFRGNTFHGEGSTDSPFATHANSIDSTQ